MTLIRVGLENRTWPHLTYNVAEKTLSGESRPDEAVRLHLTVKDWYRLME